MNRNLIILIFCQILSFTAPPITVFISGIVGLNISPIKSLATLSISLAIVGTATFTYFAAKIMSKIGRKKGFMLASILTSSASLLAAYSIYNTNFILFCISCLIIGAGVAVTHQYRFAAAEAVGPEKSAKAISFLLLAGIVSGILGPNIANFTKDIVLEHVYVGSYLSLSLLTILPVFLFLFYKPLTSKVDEHAGHARSYSDLLKHPRIFQAIISAALGYAIMAFVMTATPISMYNIHNLKLGEISIVMQLHIVGMFLPSLFTGRLIEKLGHSKMIYYGSMIYIVCIALSYFDQTLFNYIASLILLGVGWNFIFITSTDLLVKNYKSHEKFRAQGFNDLIVFSTQAIASLSAGYFVVNFTWSIINLICLPMIFVIVLSTFRADQLSKNYLNDKT